MFRLSSFKSQEKAEQVGVNGTKCGFKKGKTTCKKGKAKCTVSCQNGKMVGSTGNGSKKSCTCVNAGTDLIFKLLK